MIERYCDGGREHKPPLFAVSVVVVEIGKGHKDRRVIRVKLGHYCEICLRSPDTLRMPPVFRNRKR